MQCRLFHGKSVIGWEAKTPHGRPEIIGPTQISFHLDIVIIRAGIHNQQVLISKGQGGFANRYDVTLVVSYSKVSIHLYLNVSDNPYPQPTLQANLV